MVDYITLVCADLSRIVPHPDWEQISLVKDHRDCRNPWMHAKTPFDYSANVVAVSRHLQCVTTKRRVP